LKILVTGADGFTGRHFVRQAQAQKHTVVGLQSDLRDRTALDNEVAATEPDAVVHLAAISFVGHADVGAFYDVNVVGTLNLLDALGKLENAPSRVLLASSANIYGNCEQSPITEEQAPAPVNHYAMSKLAMEHMARTRLDELPIFIARPFNYTGVGQDISFVIPKLVDHFASKADVVELGNLDVEREFNDVRFVCEAYLRLLEHGQTGETYNVCSGHPAALRHVVDMLTSLSGHSLRVDVNPLFVRTHEVHCLCGDPGKLIKTIGQNEQPSLEDTLRWMLRSAVS
jgi:GDP-6-deoxy-D-talose 4-dehydrogenase